MKPVPVDIVSHALAATWGLAIGAAQVAMTTVAPPISDQKALLVAAVVGSLIGAFIGISSKGRIQERIATALSSIVFAMALGPISAHLVMASTSINPDLITQMLIGTSSLWAFFGWPIYKLMLALFIASGENASGIGQFIGAFARSFMRHDK